MGKIKLFCIPYAGGSGVIYNEWKKKLGDFIVVNPVELSGRGKRFVEPLYDKLEDAVEDVFNLIKDDLEEPYALYGHSMGSIIAYELCHKIIDNNLPAPEHIFFSGRCAPSIKRKKKPIHNLPDEEFKHEILDLGGTPKELFENEELLDIFIPIIKADFRVVENYIYEEKNDLDLNITVLYGEDEEWEAYEIEKWREHTRKNCNIFTTEGGHFFIHSHTDQVMKIVNNTLERCLRYRNIS